MRWVQDQLASEASSVAPFRNDPSCSLRPADSKRWRQPKQITSVDRAEGLQSGTRLPVYSVTTSGTCSDSDTCVGSKAFNPHQRSLELHNTRTVQQEVIWSLPRHHAHESRLRAATYTLDSFAMARSLNECRHTHSRSDHVDDMQLLLFEG